MNKIEFSTCTKILCWDKIYFYLFYINTNNIKLWLKQYFKVVVDDRLPVNENNQLIYCHNNTDKNEMFGPLLG
jgi:hypothetical protein